MDLIVTINDAVNNFVWGAPAIIMILITRNLFDGQTGFYSV